MQMKNIAAAFALAASAAIVGCASLDERLASTDPRVKNEAEHELIASSRENGDEAMRVAAVKRVTNKDYLYEIAMEAKSAFLTPSGKMISTTAEGVAAFGQLALDGKKIDGLKKLIALVADANSTEVRIAALNAISHQLVIGRSAAWNSNPKVRQTAWAKLNSEAGFAVVAKGAIDKKMQAEAFGKLKDQKTIDEVVLKTSDKAILLAGMSKVSDKAALASRVFSKDFIDDKEVTVKFISDYADDALLVKIVNEHGEALSSEQCAAIKAKSKNADVQKAINAIANRKAVAEIKTFVKSANGLGKVKKDKALKLAELFGQIPAEEVRCKLAIELISDEGGASEDAYSAIMSKITTKTVVAVVEACLKNDKFDKHWCLWNSLPRDAFAEVLGLYVQDFYVQSHFVELLDRVRGKECWLKFIDSLPSELRIRDYKLADLCDALPGDAVITDAFFGKFHGVFEKDFSNDTMKRLYRKLVGRLSADTKKRICDNARAKAKAMEGKSVVFGPFYMRMPYLDALVLADEIGGISVSCFSDTPTVYKVMFGNKVKFNYIDCKDSLVLPQFIHQFIEGKSGKVSGNFRYASDIKFEYSKADDRVYNAYSDTKRGIKVQYCQKDGVLTLLAL